MKPLLLQLKAVLLSDASLTSIIPTENIGQSIRQNAGNPSLEYGIEEEEADHSRHRAVTLVFVVVSNTGAVVTTDTKEALEALITAKNLSTPVLPSITPLVFKVMQARLSDSRVYPRTNWAHSLRIEFDLKIADLRPPTQKQ